MMSTKFNDHSHLICALTLTFLTFWPIIQVFSEKTDFGHGTSCEIDSTCRNYSLLLSCNGELGLCECVKSSAVILDPSIHQCQVISGKSCYRLSPSPSDDEYIHVPCVHHAICQILNHRNPNNKICQCTDQYYPNSTDGTCVKRKGYGEACEYKSNVPDPDPIASIISNECDTNNYFMCSISGRCECQPGLDHSSSLNTCYKPIGGECEKDDRFRHSAFPGRSDMCPLNADCFKGVCHCRPGYIESSDRSCQLSWGKHCNDTKNDTCSDFQLTCRNGTCQCKYPLHQIYEKGAGECLSLVPGPCSLSSSINSCIPNAECTQNPSISGSMGQCRCKSRYKQDKSGNCVKPYGYECDFDHECQNIKSELACVNNICTCPDLLQVYDREREVCLGLIGSRCSLVDAELVKYRLLLLSDQIEENNNVWLNEDSFDNAVDGNGTADDGINGYNGNGLGKTSAYSDENTLSWCIEGAECKPFGTLAQFGRVGECIGLDVFAETGV